MNVRADIVYGVIWRFNDRTLWSDVFQFAKADDVEALDAILAAEVDPKFIEKFIAQLTEAGRGVTVDIHSTTIRLYQDRWPRVGDELELCFNDAGRIFSAHLCTIPRPKPRKCKQA